MDRAFSFDGVNGYTNYVSAAVPAGAWHHAEVSVHDPTLRAGDMTNSVSLLIGAGCDSPVTRFFPGQIDEVAMFRRALDATEIAQLVSPGLDPTCVP